MEEAGGRFLQPNTQFGLSDAVRLVAAAHLNEVRSASHMLPSIEPPRATTPGGFLLILRISARSYTRTGTRFPKTVSIASFLFEAQNFRLAEYPNPTWRAVSSKLSLGLISPYRGACDSKDSSNINSCQNYTHIVPLPYWMRHRS